MMSNKEELFNKVKNSLDSIRPFLEADGGDISLVDVTDEMTARIEFHGACCGCSMSTMTLRAGVEGAIRNAVPEILSVEAITKELI
ncbi:MAG: NifU family protein [Flavobacteriales bacterium]|nr:NifU family protein [Flavobacteriales bacterium]